MRAVAPKDTSTISASSHHERLGTLLAGLHRLIALETLDVQALELVCRQVERVHDVVFALAFHGRWWPKASPAAAPRVSGKHDGLHHLAEHAVGEDHGRHAILVGLTRRPGTPGRPSPGRWKARTRAPGNRRGPWRGWPASSRIGRAGYRQGPGRRAAR